MGRWQPQELFGRYWATRGFGRACGYLTLEVFKVPASVTTRRYEGGRHLPLALPAGQGAPVDRQRAGSLARRQKPITCHFVSRSRLTCCDPLANPDYHVSLDCLVCYV